LLRLWKTLGEKECNVESTLFVNLTRAFSAPFSSPLLLKLKKREMIF
jgi:hypothetical protein